MADNYLEKRYEEVFDRGGRNASPSVHKPALDTLLLRNRSYRGYDKDHVVHRLQMEAIVGVNTKLASARNAQTLRFRMIVKGPESQKVLEHVKMGAALPELHLPLPGTEPEAFIIVCGTQGESTNVCIDLGISLQSMLLKAVELGLGGLIIRAFDKESIRRELDLPYEPLAILAIGRPAEKIELVPVREGESLKYTREDGVHKVPKIRFEDILI